MIDFDTLASEPAVETFGEPVTYTPQGHDPFALNGIFDEAYAASEFRISRHDQPVSTVGPGLGVRLADFPVGVKPQQGDTLTVTRTGESFTVADVQPDGLGFVYLILN